MSNLLSKAEQTRGWLNPFTGVMTEPEVQHTKKEQQVLRRCRWEPGSEQTFCFFSGHVIKYGNLFHLEQTYSKSLNEFVAIDLHPGYPNIYHTLRELVIAALKAHMVEPLTIWMSQEKFEMVLMEQNNPHLNPGLRPTWDASDTPVTLGRMFNCQVISHSYGYPFNNYVIVGD